MDVITPYREIRLSVCKKQRCAPGPQNCRTPVEPKIPLNLPSMRLLRRFTSSSDSVCGSASPTQGGSLLRNRLPAFAPQDFSPLRGMIIRSCRILVCNPLKPGCAVPVLLQFDACEAIRAQTKEALAALGRHLSGITSKRQTL